MILCSNSWLIKLCVVFLLNISWFTTGTAPPLSLSQRLTLTPPSIQPTPTLTLAFSTSCTTSPSTTNEGDAGASSGEVVASPASSSGYVNVTVGQSSTIKPTSSTEKGSSRVSPSILSLSEGREVSSSPSLSKNFQSTEKEEKLSDSESVGADDDDESECCDASIALYTKTTKSDQWGKEYSTASSTTDEKLSPTKTSSNFLLKTQDLRIGESLGETNEEEGSSLVEFSPEGEHYLLESEYLEEDDEDFSSLKVGLIFDKDYSPEEIAEYIFLSGDESGVAWAINDLINDGLMLSRREAIKFLEKVQSHLENLKSQYQSFLISEGKEEDGTSTSTMALDFEEDDSMKAEMSSKKKETRPTNTNTNVYGSILV